MRCGGGGNGGGDDDEIRRIVWAPCNNENVWV